MERVADVLARKYPQFNTVSPGHFVSDALYQMCAENVDYLIVLENERFSGIVTSNDIANRVLFTDKPLNQVRVQDFMNTNLPVATMEDSIEYCMQLLERYQSKFLVIYDRFDFKGIITAQDLMQEALSKRHTIFENMPLAEHPYNWSY